MEGLSQAGHIRALKLMLYRYENLEKALNGMVGCEGNKEGLCPAAALLDTEAEALREAIRCIKIVKDSDSQSAGQGLRRLDEYKIITADEIAARREKGPERSERDESCAERNGSD